MKRSSKRRRIAPRSSCFAHGTAATAAAPLAKQLDRRAIRKRFEERFTAERMARDYLTLYQRVLLGGTEAVEARVLDDTEAIEPKLLTFAAREGLAQAAE